MELGYSYSGFNVKYIMMTKSRVKSSILTDFHHNNISLKSRFRKCQSLETRKLYPQIIRDSFGPEVPAFWLKGMMIWYNSKFLSQLAYDSPCPTLSFCSSYKSLKERVLQGMMMHIGTSGQFHDNAFLLLPRIWIPISKAQESILGQEVGLLGEEIHSRFQQN
jgi:hypothetical protein